MAPSLTLAASLAPLACWGILAYAAYLGWKFGEPLAFVKTQAAWSHAPVASSPWLRAWELATLAPLRAVYEPGSPCHWASEAPGVGPLFISRRPTRLISPWPRVRSCTVHGAACSMARKSRWPRH